MPSRRVAIAHAAEVILCARRLGGLGPRRSPWCLAPRQPLAAPSSPARPSGSYGPKRSICRKVTESGRSGRNVIVTSPTIGSALAPKASASIT